MLSQLFTNSIYLAGKKAQDISAVSYLYLFFQETSQK